MENIKTNTLSEFHKVNPIEFKLWDKDMLELLPITDDPKGYPLILEIKNTSASDIKIPKDGEFELRFRPNTLSKVCKEKLNNFNSKEWEIKHKENSDHTNSIIFKSKEAQILKVGDENSIKISLDNMSAEASGGARGARVELRYQKLHFSEKEDELNGYRTTHMNIVKLTGHSSNPFYIDFMDENIILNNGTSHKLSLKIANQNEETMKLNSSSKFVISLDSGDNSIPWALATKKELDSIDTKLDTQKWTIIKDEQAIEPTWEIKPKGTIDLKKGEGITIELSNICTTHRAGVSCLYVRYHNMSGFKDGYEVLKIKKVSIPPLHKGMIMMWSGSISDIPQGWALCDGKNGTLNLTDRFIIAAGGKYSVDSRGGEEKVTLTEQEMPKHEHSGTVHTKDIVNGGGSREKEYKVMHPDTYDAACADGHGGGRSIYDRGGNNSSHDLSWCINFKHDHSLTINEKGGSLAHNNIPPYYALCFIMCIGNEKRN